MVEPMSGITEFAKVMEAQRKLHALFLMLRNTAVICGVAFVALACGVLAKEQNAGLDGSSILWGGSACMLSAILLTIGMSRSRVLK